MAFISRQITQNIVRGDILLAVLSRCIERYIERFSTATFAKLLRLS